MSEARLEGAGYSPIGRDGIWLRGLLGVIDGVIALSYRWYVLPLMIAVAVLVVTLVAVSS